MAELVEMTVFHCLSVTSFEQEVVGKTGRYTVRRSFMPKGPYQYGWSCTCRGFKYGKGKPCSHIKDLMIGDTPGYCGWNVELEPTMEPDWVDEKPACPECGGPVVIAKVGV